MEQAQPSEQTKLYNIIFPVWLLIFFPPVILVSLDPYSNFLAFTLILVAIFISGLLILLFNYNYTFRRSIKDVLARWKAAALIAVVTLPWTFLLPAKLFY